MKKFVIALLITIMLFSLISCGNTGQQTTSTTDNKDVIKSGVISFISNLSKTATLPEYVMTNLQASDTYTLNVNKSGSGIFFHLVVHMKDNIPPTEVTQEDINITIEGSTMTVEGSAPITFNDVASMVFSDSSVQWVLHLFYDKTSMFTVGSPLPRGAKLFVISVNEDSPWDAYISLKSNGVVEKDPTEQDGIYTLRLTDGHTVYMVGNEGSVDIYK